ncbi:YncE family protein [Brackiella oedipodis]|uniref:YncE family protein n=1 Tax=Brackiella oedipodis TaxID=124225 RepID=UPI00048EB34B|nr:hypothetical protein [Brackiella oedipodis]
MSTPASADNNTSPSTHNQSRTYFLGLEKGQFYIIVGLFVLVLTFFVSGFWYYLDLVPDYVYSPSRYAYVSDKRSDQLAIIDLKKNQQIARYNLGITPDILTIATDFPMMAYANRQENRLVFYNLKKQSKQFIRLPSEPIDMFFIPNQQSLLLVMQDQIALVDYDSGNLYQLPNPPGIKQFDKAHLPVFSALSNSLWLANQATQELLQLKVNQQHNSAWQRLPLRLADAEKPGPLAVNAQGTIMAFAKENGQQAYIYDLAQQQLHRVSDLSDQAKPVDPYLDANQQFAVFGDDQGLVVGLNPLTQTLIKRVHLPSPVKKIRGGWLNQYWIAIADGGLAIIPANPDQAEQWFASQGQVQDVWITGDGKTALLSVTGGHELLMPFDIKNGQAKAPIVLDGILEANLVRMGGNNSFCY